MKLIRPEILMVQRRDAPEFSLQDLLGGGPGVVESSQWVVYAPHLDEPVVVELEDLSVIDAVPRDEPLERAALEVRFEPARVRRLVEAGVLVSDDSSHARHRERLASLRATAWWPPAAVMQAFGRWDGVDVAAIEQSQGKRTLAGMIEKFGAPPPATIDVRELDSRVALPAPTRTPLDELLAARSTCRNFDASHSVELADLASILHRVFGAQASAELHPGAVMLKKNSPSGGGLHPIDAYVLAQRVQGLATGVYHYLADAHALESMQLLGPEEASARAHELVAGQAWFANAPVLVLMAARFQRNFWKYQNHPKAWKVIQLDAGHLSQNFYLSATERRLGAFVTGAINDRSAERVFELDGLATGAIAVCGLGKRAAASEDGAAEFDPLGKAVR